VITPCAFDQLHTASILGGYSAAIKSNAPICSRYLSVGSSPFVGVFDAVEGSTQPLMSDVAFAVASKLKSALISAASGWWFGSKQQAEDPSAAKKKPKVEPATSLPIRFSIPDLRRHGDSIHIAPTHRLAVTTDSFGRVMLIDICRGIVVRIWK
ncbi:rab3 GTPase-activating protein non-catalytic subunit-like, partial [Anneissia japonica]|uniref:rab3 GTPase-activating protein non-catalytic subunit-like n=1 Tax=Anneissia japonica TaxID=1529436 RepID=UPI0014254E78